MIMTTITTNAHPLITVANKKAVQLFNKVYNTKKAEGPIKDENSTLVM